MINKQLTASLEDYLEAIAELTAVDGHAHAKEIAVRLNVKMPSVTGALRQLDQMGYITYNAHYPVELTAMGAEVAGKVMHRHNVLESFFSGILGLSHEKASEMACRIEHVVDAETIQRFVLFSEAIRGRQDARKLQIFLTEAMAAENGGLFILADLPAGNSAVIAKTGRNIPAGIPVQVAAGDKVTSQGFTLDKTAMKLLRNNEVLEIPVEIAENIWCS